MITGSTSVPIFSVFEKLPADLQKVACKYVCTGNFDDTFASKSYEQGVNRCKRE